VITDKFCEYARAIEPLVEEFVGKIQCERAKLEPPQEDEDYELCLQKMRTEAVQPV